MSQKREEQIEVLRQAIAAKNRRIAELRQQLSGHRYQEWLAELREWADTPHATLDTMPTAPKDLYPVAELTDEQRAAREAWIDQAIEDAKKWGIIK